MDIELGDAASIVISRTPPPPQKSAVTPASRPFTMQADKDSNSSTGNNTVPDWLLLSQMSKFQCSVFVIKLPSLTFSCSGQLFTDCIAVEDALHVRKICTLAESELLFYLYRANGKVSEISSFWIELSGPVCADDLSLMSNPELGNSWLNIKQARQNLIDCLASAELPYPTENQLIVEWLAKRA